MADQAHKPNRLKAKFYYIRKLIRAKEYNRARYLLLSIDHPKAEEWLDKLNRLDPNYSEQTIVLLKPVLLLLGLGLIALVVLVVAGRLDRNSAFIIGSLGTFAVLLLMSIWSRIK